MSEEMMNTKEVAQYLGIHEKQVYALIKAGRIPCTRITGKWVFPRHIIDEWITENARGEVLQHTKRDMEGVNAIYAAGSNDPILDILISSITSDNFYVFSCSTGSTAGLSLLQQGSVDVSWCHLLDAKTGQYNLPYLQEHLGDLKIAVVHLFNRELGFLSTPSLPSPVASFDEIVQKKLRFINRQKGAGTRVLTDYHLEKNGIDPSLIRGYGREVYTHFEIGLAILSGEADTGIATVAVSKLLGLPFAPIVRESFDMVLTQDAFFHQAIQAFIERLRSDEFRTRVSHLGNYDFGESGKILYSNR